MLSYAGITSFPALILIRDLHKSKPLGPKPASAYASRMKKRRCRCMCRAIGLALRSYNQPNVSDFDDVGKWEVSNIDQNAWTL